MTQVLIIRDSDEVICGVYLIPEGMTQPEAKDAASDAIDKVKELDPDEWNYEGVGKILAEQGLVSLDYADMYE